MRNGMDNDAPASDAVLALDAPGARRDDPPPVVGADEPRPGSERQPSRRVVSRARARPGRPTRLTATLAAQLVAAVRETGWIRPAAARCGIPENVAREWIQRGKGEHPTRGATREFAAFAADIARAQGEWEAHQLAVLDAAAAKGPQSWGAVAWKLERFDRETYGRRERIDMSRTITLEEAHGMLVAVVDLVQRYVPRVRQEAEIANFIATAREAGARLALPDGTRTTAMPTHGRTP